MIGHVAAPVDNGAVRPIRDRAARSGWCRRRGGRVWSWRRAWGRVGCRGWVMRSWLNRAPRPSPEASQPSSVHQDSSLTGLTFDASSVHSTWSAEVFVGSPRFETSFPIGSPATHCTGMRPLHTTCSTPTPRDLSPDPSDQHPGKCAGRRPPPFDIELSGSSVAAATSLSRF